MDEVLNQLLDNIEICQDVKVLIKNNNEYYKNQLESIFDIDEHLNSGSKELNEKRREVYNSYINYISKFIDKYEIRHHDLPESIQEMLNDLVIEFSNSFKNDITDDARRIERVERAISIEGCLGYYICQLLIAEYLDILKSYKKSFSLLNHETIKYKNTEQSYFEHLKDEIKHIKLLFKTGEKQFKQFFHKDENGIQYNFNAICTIEEYDEAIKRCETLLKEIEGEVEDGKVEVGYFTKALNEGGKQSVKALIIKYLIEVGIPFVLTIVTVALWVKKIII